MTRIRNSTDAYVSEATGKSYPNKRRLYLAGDAATDTRYSYHFFGLPSGLAGCTVHSATFNFYSGGGDWSGSVPVNFQRLSQIFSLDTLKWTKKPGVTGAVATLSKTGATDKTLWTIDIQPQMQQVADGAEWYGFRLDTTGTVGRFLYSSEAEESLRPYIEIEYSEAPEAPEGLWPSGGKSVSVTKPLLRWNFVDEDGDSSQVSYDLRFFATEAAALANTTPTWSVAGQASTLSEADLNALGYSGLAADQSVWWRVRVTNDSGQTSAWSDPANFIRTTKGTLTINNPAASPNNFVQESSPPITWSFTGRTQETYCVTIVDTVDPTRVWTSGPITSTETSVTPDEWPINTPGAIYRLTVEIWDTIDRASVPSDPAQVIATREFFYARSGTVTGVTGLTSSNDPARPARWLDFSRSTAPDEFVIFRDGVEVDTVVPGDIFVSGTSYRYIDRSAPLRKDVTWSVSAKVNGVTSLPTSTTGKVTVNSTYLCTLDGTREVFLLNRTRSGTRSDTSAVHRLLGGGPPVAIFQALGGYEGKVQGTLASEAGVAAETQAANLEWIRKNRGTPLLLTWTNRTMKVVAFNVEVDPVSYPDGTVDYLAEFEFVEI